MKIVLKSILQTRTTGHFKSCFWIPGFYFMFLSEFKCPNICLYRADVIWTGRATRHSAQTSDICNDELSKFLGVMIYLQIFFYWYII